MSTQPFETLLLEFDRAARVATITLNRPDRLNTFNRTMCEEMQAVWDYVKGKVWGRDVKNGKKHVTAA